MVELAIGIGGVLLMLSGYFLGEKLTEQRLRSENVMLTCVQEELNAVITNQRHKIDSVDGLWATDQPELIRHHNKRERFFCIGHPERKL